MNINSSEQDDAQDFSILLSAWLPYLSCARCRLGEAESRAPIAYSDASYLLPLVHPPSPVVLLKGL